MRSSNAVRAFSARTRISLSSSTACRLARELVFSRRKPVSSSSSVAHFLRQVSISTLVRFALVSRSTRASSRVAVSCFSAYRCFSIVRIRVSCSSNCCDVRCATSCEAWREPGGEVVWTGEAVFSGGDTARPSMPFVGCGVPVPDEPGSGGRGTDGGGVGRAVAPLVFCPCEAPEPALPRAVVAGSGDNESRFSDAFDAADWRCRTSSCF